MAIFTFVVLTGCCAAVIYDGEWPGLLVLILPVVLVIHTYCTTRYSINNSELIIKSGFYKKKIDIQSIRKITETTGFITAPALSVYRLELFFKGYDSIEISPKDKEVFIAHLKKINTAIVYQPKTGK